MRSTRDLCEEAGHDTVDVCRLPWLKQHHGQGPMPLPYMDDPLDKLQGG